MEHLKTKNQIKAMTQADFQNVLKAHTDKNYHTENVVFIAMRYGTKQQLARAEMILMAHNKIGCMTPKLHTLRSTLLNELKARMLPCHQQSVMECL